MRSLAATLIADCRLLKLPIPGSITGPDTSVHNDCEHRCVRPTRGLRHVLNAFL